MLLKFLIFSKNLAKSSTTDSRYLLVKIDNAVLRSFHDLIDVCLIFLVFRLVTGKCMSTTPTAPLLVSKEEEGALYS